MISREDIEALAGLARLKLTDGEKVALGKDISNILEYVGQINSFSADTSKSEKPIVRNVLRNDDTRNPTDVMFEKRDAIIAQFPRQEEEYNVVRKIIQKDE